MGTAEELSLIKGDFRRGMNGVVAANMRERGVCYKINFGLTLPILRSVASKYDKNATLAEKLWSEDVRESKLLAPMLYPEAEMSIDTALRWIEGICYNEVSDICCMFLFWKLPFALELAVECTQSDNPSKRYLGISLLNRLLINGADLDRVKIKNIAENLLNDVSPIVAMAANNLLHISS